jgi:hypothetical protein
MMILFIMTVLNGLTFCLVVILIGIIDYINEGTVSITPAIEVISYLVAAIVLTSFCFR